jgi:hypothetical protein
LVSGENGVEDYDDNANRFNRSFPSLIFRFSIKLTGIIGLALIACALGVCRISVVQNEVPRQPDCDSAWFAFRLGVAIIFVGQAIYG